MPALDLSATPSHYALGDDDGDRQDVTSSWRTLQKLSTSSSQTDALTTTEAACQSTLTASSASQTASEAQPTTEPLSDASELSEGCRRWLAGVLGMVEAQLLHNASSHAFDGFTVSWDDDREAVTKLHTLQHTAQSSTRSPSSAPATAGPAAAACTAMSWNSTGSLIAVAYGALHHSGWCSHSGLIAVWNIHRRQLVPTAADVTVELASCVSALCFHPSAPSLLVVGLHTGQIRVFDLSNSDDPLLFSSAISALHHCEPVTALTFVAAQHPAPAAPAAPAASGLSAPSSHLLLSTSLDGKVLTWSLDNALSHPITGALCSPSAHYHGHGSSNSFPSLSITALSLSSDRVQYVVGTQGGGVLRGSHRQHKPRTGLVKRGEVKWTKDALFLFELAPAERQFEGKKVVEQHAALAAATLVDASVVFSSPIPPASLYPPLATSALRAHHSTVTSLAFSPFHSRLLLSLSSDRSLRLYCLGRDEEVWGAVLSSGSAGLDCCWSVSRPLVFAVSDSDGGVEVWDLSADAMRAVLVLKVEETAASGRGVAVVRLRWNTADGSVLGAVDALGRAHVWQLSGKLSSPQPGEQRSLDAIADSQR